jgi:hypothetical protein
VGGLDVFEDPEADADADVDADAELLPWLPGRRVGVGTEDRLLDRTPLALPSSSETCDKKLVGARIGGGTLDALDMRDTMSGARLTLVAPCRMDPPVADTWDRDEVMGYGSGTGAGPERGSGSPPRLCRPLPPSDTRDPAPALSPPPPPLRLPPHSLCPFCFSGSDSDSDPDPDPDPDSTSVSVSCLRSWAPSLSSSVSPAWWLPLLPRLLPPSEMGGR